MEEQNIISEINKYVSEEKAQSWEDGVQFERNRILGVAEGLKIPIEHPYTPNEENKCSSCEARTEWNAALAKLMDEVGKA